MSCRASRLLVLFCAFAFFRGFSFRQVVRIYLCSFIRLLVLASMCPFIHSALCPLYSSMYLLIFSTFVRVSICLSMHRPLVVCLLIRAIHHPVRVSIIQIISLNLFRPSITILFRSIRPPVHHSIHHIHLFLLMPPNTIQNSSSSLSSLSPLSRWRGL